jgi:hypothetical protein
MMSNTSPPPAGYQADSESERVEEQHAESATVTQRRNADSCIKTVHAGIHKRGRKRKCINGG